MYWTSSPATAQGARQPTGLNADGTVFAMFTEISKLQVLGLDARTGKTLSKHEVKGSCAWGQREQQTRLLKLWSSPAHTPPNRVR